MYLQKLNKKAKKNFKYGNNKEQKKKKEKTRELKNFNDVCLCVWIFSWQLVVVISWTKKNCRKKKNKCNIGYYYHMNQSIIIELEYITTIFSVFSHFFWALGCEVYACVWVCVCGRWNFAKNKKKRIKYFVYEVFISMFFLFSFECLKFIHSLWNK